MFFKCNNCELGSSSTCVGGAYVVQNNEKERPIMIIGDFPHDSDTVLGKPFSEKHSITMANLFKHANIKKEDVYITTLVKCKPVHIGGSEGKKEGTIKASNISSCSIYLMEEIVNVAPKAILLLGEKVFSYFYKNQLFSDCRGKVMHNDLFNVDTVATYNPVIMAYSNKFDQLIRTDFLTFANHVYGKTEEKNKNDYRFPLKSLDILRQTAKRVKEVETFAFDIETHGTGLFDFKLLSISFSWKEHTGISVPVWVMDEEKKKSLESVANMTFSKKKVTEKVVLPDGTEKTKTKTTSAPNDEERSLMKSMLPEEYKWIADIKEIKAVKSTIHQIIDKKPPLKKYWGDNHDECMSLIKEIMECDTPKGAHNGSYDVNRLRGMGINVKNYAWDTILMHHLLDEERPHNLDDLSFVYTTDGGYKSEKNIYLSSKQTSWANIPVEVLLPYNAEDSDITLRLYHIFIKKLQEENLLDLFNNVTMPAQRILLDMSYRGVIIDVDYVKKQIEEMKEEINNKKIEFYQIISKSIPNCQVVDSTEEGKKLKDEIEKSGNKENAPYIFNMNSKDDLVYLFRDVYHVKLTKKTATGDSLDAAVLKKLVKKHPAAQILLDYKNTQKLLSTYFLSALENKDHNNRLHTEFLLYGTVTGRLSSKNPNLQNIPRGTKVKRMFIAPKGYVIVNVDQSAAELHVLAGLSRDPKMCHAFETKQDLHRITAASVFNKKPEDISSEERTIAKRVSFGIAYGISGKGLADILEPEGVKISESQGKLYIEKWRKMYRYCDMYINKCVSNFNRYGYLRTPFGRKRRKYKKFYDKSKENSSERQAQNFPIQSTASDIQLIEMVKMYDTLIKNGVLPVLTVHDSIVMYCPHDKLEWLRSFYKENTCVRYKEINNMIMETEMEVGRSYDEHVKLPYDCDFAEWKTKNANLFN